jgi:hypothetical protein
MWTCTSRQVFLAMRQDADWHYSVAEINEPNRHPGKARTGRKAGPAYNKQK